MGGHAQERLVLVAQIAVVHRRQLQESQLVALVALVGREYAHELGGIVHRQRMQQHGIDQREDRRVGADAKRERQHRRKREARVLGDQTGAVFQIPEEGGHRLILDGVGPAEAADLRRRRRLTRASCKVGVKLAF